MGLPARCRLKNLSNPSSTRVRKNRKDQRVVLFNLGRHAQLSLEI